jgi:subtilase family serine protease
MRDQAGLNAFLKQLYDPSSPYFRHWLTPDQFAQRFGPTEQDYQAVRDFAVAHGLTVSGTYPSRLLVDVTGSVSDIEQALHVSINTYHHPKEARDFFAPDKEPSLDLTVPVLHISGLDSYSLPHPASLHRKPVDLSGTAKPNAGSGTGGSYLGNDFRNAYLPGVSLAGAGQIVGLLEFDGYFASDIAAYVKKAGLAPVPLENVFIDGFNGTPGGGNVEVALDIEVVIAMAPEISKIIVYQAPNPSPWVDIVGRMASDTQVKQFSSSWAGGADSSTDQLFQQMAAQGQSFFQASGDDDAYTGDIPHPSDSPYVTSVGGTTLTTSTNGGAYVSESVWNWGGGTGSSGGVSTTYPIPSWQENINMGANKGSTTFRNIPDVALTADNIFVVENNGSEDIVGGTSAAAPLWAAVTALANQQIASGCGASLGFLNPTIYGIGKGSSYASDFNDILVGNNFSPGSPTKFRAYLGYDLCTGWGSPKPALLTALAGNGTGALSVSIDPLSGSSLISTDQVPVFVTVSGVTNATVFATVTGPTSFTLNFHNNAQFPDAVANDFIYSAVLRVPTAPATLSLTVVTMVTNRPSVTNFVTYNVIPPPLNDNFANATKVLAGGSVYLANNRYATIEPDEPFQNDDTNRAGSLWWAWTPSANTSVLVDTSGSRVDNVLAVYTGSALSTLQKVASASSDVSQIKPGHVVFNAVAGQG